MDKTKAKMALESLIAQCYREIRNLEQFSDKRMLIATADLAYHYAVVMEAAEDLEDAYNDSIFEEDEPQEDTEDNYLTLGLEPRGRAQ